MKIKSVHAPGLASHCSFHCLYACIFWGKSIFFEKTWAAPCLTVSKCFKS